MQAEDRRRKTGQIGKAGFIALALLLCAGAHGDSMAQEAPGSSAAAKIILTVPEWQVTEDESESNRKTVLREGDARILCLRTDQSPSYAITAHGSGAQGGFELKGANARALGYEVALHTHPESPPVLMEPSAPVTGIVPETGGCRAETAPNIRFSLGAAARAAAAREAFTGALYVVVMPY